MMIISQYTFINIQILPEYMKYKTKHFGTFHLR